MEMEGLASVLGVKKFHSCLVGHRFVLQTDHKPLLTLFNETKAAPQQASGPDSALGVDTRFIRIHHCMSWYTGAC